MANCNALFRVYNDEIKLSEADRQELMKRRQSLRDRIIAGFNKLPSNNLTLDFQTQGSFVMDTIIDPSKKDYDLDDGVYFIGKSTVKEAGDPMNYHNFVLQSINIGKEEGEIETAVDKDTCVRVKYKPWGSFTTGFHIDLPIYYGNDVTNPHLAHKKGWVESNPIEFIDWFETKIANSKFQKAFIYEGLKMYNQFEKWTADIRKEDEQLRRIVRYLKGWGDNLRDGNYMPPGIVLSILTAMYHKEEKSDDVALYNVLKGIHGDVVKHGVQCLRPTTEKNEDIMANEPANKKDFFKTELKKFVESAEQAIANPNQKEACAKWQKHLGPRFSCALASDIPEGAETQTKKPFIGAPHRTA